VLADSQGLRMNAISNILKAAGVAGARTDELDAIKENGVMRIAMIGDNPLRACRPFERLRFILGVQLAETLLGHGGGDTQPDVKRFFLAVRWLLLSVVPGRRFVRFRSFCRRRRGGGSRPWSPWSPSRRPKAGRPAPACLTLLLRSFAPASSRLRCLPEISKSASVPHRPPLVCPAPAPRLSCENCMGLQWNEQATGCGHARA